MNKKLEQITEQTLKAPGVMKEMLLWSRVSNLSEGRVPKALSDRNLSLFFSRLIEEASQGNSLGSSAMLERSQSTLQLFSWVQVQDAGQARTHAHRANAAWGSRVSTHTEKRTGGSMMDWNNSSQSELLWILWLLMMKVYIKILSYIYQRFLHLQTKHKLEGALNHSTEDHESLWKIKHVFASL